MRCWAAHSPEGLRLTEAVSNESTQPGRRLPVDQCLNQGNTPKRLLRNDVLVSEFRSLAHNNRQVGDCPQGHLPTSVFAAVSCSTSWCREVHVIRRPEYLL